jgi:hypothetical protein
LSVRLSRLRPRPETPFRRSACSSRGCINSGRAGLTAYRKPREPCSSTTPALLRRCSDLRRRRPSRATC